MDKIKFVKYVIVHLDYLHIRNINAKDVLEVFVANVVFIGKL